MLRTLLASLAIVTISQAASAQFQPTPAPQWQFVPNQGMPQSNVYRPIVPQQAVPNSFPYSYTPNYGGSAQRCVMQPNGFGDYSLRCQ
jgi:hypothetical protein